MILHLSNFQEEIDPVILDRGRDYWAGGAVDNVTKRSDGTVKAVVYGSEMYRVQLKISGDIVETYSCDCPYDWGPVCKHIAAVLYGLTDIEIQGSSTTDAPDLRKVLTELPKEELIDIIEEITDRDDLWENLLLARYTPKTEDNGYSYYEHVLRSSLDAISDRGGFIGYRQAETAAAAASRLLDEAETDIMDSEYEQAMTILHVVMITMHEALSYSDDSNGYIGGSIESAISLLRDLSESNPPPDIVKLIFDLIINKDLLNRLSDFSWDWDLLHIGVPLVGNEADADKLLKAAEGCIAGTDGWSHGYAEERYALLQLALIERQRPRREAEIFIEENIQHPAFRKIVLRKYFEQNKYDHLLQIASEGIEQHKNSAPGLVSEWYSWIVKGAEKAGDTETLQDALEKLYYNRHNLEYYKKLKSTYSPDVWSGKRDDIIRKLETGPYGQHAVYAVFIEEGLKERLWDSLNKNMTIDSLDHYDNYLLPDFSSELSAAYSKLIIPAIENRKGRGFYSQIAEILVRLRKAGEQEKVKEIVNEILLRFRNRPALKDELNNCRLF